MRSVDSRVGITEEELSVDEALQWVSSPKAGGTVTFVGTVRDSSDGKDVSGLELESGGDLASADLERIAKAALEYFRLCKISVQHRVGRLSIGDKIVVIAVSAPHRDDAFLACRFVIDELKKTTPIWKKEFGHDGGRWVEGGHGNDG